ncbi:MAG: peptidoglycan DD-metalloendopeptidase family protein, partial [Proteobacteria bacterium]|nr:peptidoglycan DD-metalloendopeptidase family protein [Pseudomonadota bacterium]
ATASRNSQLGGTLEVLEHQLVESLAERGRLAVERDRLAHERQKLAAELGAAERRQLELIESQNQALARVSERIRSDAEAMSILIARTGLDPNRLLAQTGTSGGGGPFIDARTHIGIEPIYSGLVSLGAQIGRVEDLKRLMRALPTAAPLDSVEVMSPFGIRRDPFNGQLAMHSGIDLAAPAKTPIMATAAGTVVFAGWAAEYGNLVEIDHGFGLRTRYGHLSRINVKLGQKVAIRHIVGHAGSTGRSTGSHLHYEVMSDGKNLDPKKFMEAGKYVLKG